MTPRSRHGSRVAGFPIRTALAKIAFRSLLSVAREAVDSYLEVFDATRYQHKADRSNLLLSRSSCTHTGFELYPLRADLHRSDREGRHDSYDSIV